MENEIEYLKNNGFLNATLTDGFITLDGNIRNSVGKYEKAEGYFIYSVNKSLCEDFSELRTAVNKLIKLDGKRALLSLQQSELNQKIKAFMCIYNARRNIVDLNDLFSTREPSTIFNTEVTKLSKEFLSMLKSDNALNNMLVSELKAIFSKHGIQHHMGHDLQYVIIKRGNRK